MIEVENIIVFDIIYQAGDARCAQNGVRKKCE